MGLSHSQIGYLNGLLALEYFAMLVETWASTAVLQGCKGITSGYKINNWIKITTNVAAETKNVVTLTLQNFKFIKMDVFISQHSKTKSFSGVPFLRSPILKMYQDIVVILRRHNEKNKVKRAT